MMLRQEDCSSLGQPGLQNEFQANLNDSMIPLSSKETGLEESNTCATWGNGSQILEAEETAQTLCEHRVFSEPLVVYHGIQRRNSVAVGAEIVW